MAGKVDELLKVARDELKKGNWDSSKKILGVALGMLDGEDLDREGEQALSEVLRLRSCASSRMGEFKEGVEDAKRAMNISARIKDQVGEADALRRLGYVHWRKGDLPMANEFYTSALDLAARCEARSLQGTMLIELGNVTISAKDYPRGERLFQEAMDMLEAEGEMSELARAINNLGSCYMDQRKFELAIPTFDRCMRIAEEAGDMTDRGWSAFNMADCLVQTGKADRALGYLSTAMNLLEKMEDKVGIAITHMIYGKAYTELKDWPEAEANFEKCQFMLRDMQIPLLEGEAHMFRGDMWRAKGENGPAKEDYERAIEIFENADLKKDAENVRVRLGELA